MSRFKQIVLIMVLLLLNVAFSENRETESLCGSNESGEKCSSSVPDVAMQLHDTTEVTGVDEEGRSDAADVNKANSNSEAVEPDASMQTSDVIADQSSDSMPAIAPIAVASNLSVQTSIPVVAGANTSVQSSAFVADESNKSTPASAPMVVATDSNMQSSAHVAVNSSSQASPPVVAAANSSIQASADVVPGESQISQNSTNIVAQANSSTLSNAGTTAQKPKHAVTQQQTGAAAVTLSTLQVALTKGVETTKTADGEHGDGVASQDSVANSDLDSAQLVALAEGVVIADAVVQVGNGDKSQPEDEDVEMNLSPAQVVAVAEGVEMAEAVVQAVQENEPAVNAIWRATLEAESSWKQNEVPPDEEGLDKALISLLGCVMIVLAITGSAAAMVLYKRLRKAEEEDELNMYVLVDDSDSQSTFGENRSDSNGVSYTFPSL